MSSKFFGQYLLEKGIVDRDQLLEGIKYQKEKNRNLAEVAFDLKLITEEQLSEILFMQQQGVKEIRQIMLDLKYVNEDRLKYIEKIYEEKRIYIGEALVKLGYIEQDELYNLLEQYHTYQDDSYFKFSEIVNTIGPKHIVEATIEATVSVFRKLLNTSLKIDETFLKTQTLPNDGYFITQEVEGDYKVRFVFHFPLTIVLELSSVMSGQSLKKDLTIQFKDMLSEFVNIVIGNLCSNVSSNEDGCMDITSPPVFYNSKKEKPSLYPEKNNILINFLYPTLKGNVEKLRLIIEFRKEVEK